MNQDRPHAGDDTITGGMETWSDREFIDYCRLHVETPRRLFSGYQVNRLRRLAGEPEFPLTDKSSWGRGDYEFIVPLCDAAIRKMAAAEGKGK